LVDAQTVGVLATAASVTVAAIYYMITLRETLRNRRVTLAIALMQSFVTVDGSLNWAKIMTMEWRDAADFDAKYSARINPENYAMRNNIWNTLDIIGHQYRSGLIDLDTIWSICSSASAQCWAKFKPIIEDYKRTGKFSKNHYKDWEFLAGIMARRVNSADSSYRGSSLYMKPDDWENAFMAKKPQ
jgi:hypothetical protein